MQRDMYVSVRVTRLVARARTPALALSDWPCPLCGAGSGTMLIEEWMRYSSMPLGASHDRDEVPAAGMHRVGEQLDPPGTVL